jgi:SAM-dependent methyltransferase
MSGTCEVCGEAGLDVVPDFAYLRRVTSDCRSFARGGALYQCRGCGAVQKRNDSTWRADCAAIYAAYDSYGLSTGVEQSVRSGDGVEFAPRSEIVLRQLKSRIRLPKFGRILDFGCGKGPTSRAASLVLQGWTIDGFDQDDRALAEVSTIDGFQCLYTGGPETLPSGYDLIVLMHALEHIPDAARVLELLAGKLNPGGHILCQVPNREVNPYDLLVADHLIHFDFASLMKLGERTGFLVEVRQDWIVKELSLVLSPSGSTGHAPPRRSTIAAARQVDWLRQVVETCERAATHRPFCIFGTSIVATWLASELSAAPDLYLDEDPARIGHRLNGVPIAAPAEAPSGATVVLAIAPAVAAAVAVRLAPLGLNFVKTPAYSIG